MVDIEQDLFDFLERPASIIDYLNSLSFDELVEVDLFNDRIRNLFHVEGKYYVPVFDGAHKDLYRFASENMIHPSDKAVHESFMNHDTLPERLEKSSIPGVISEEFRYRLQEGGWCWVRQVIVGGPRFDFPEGVIRFYVFDIQTRKQRELGEAVIGYRATSQRNSLTGLRREKEFLADAFERIRSHECEGWCLVALDIDQFKFFNDWNGREAGDFVLAKIGSYLVKRELADKWICAYLGQDDFCVLMPHSNVGVEELYTAVADIIESFESSMSFAPMLGVTMVDETAGMLDMFDNAKIALEEAKHDFKHRICYFKPEMFAQTDAEYRLLTDFQKALADDDIYFALQPQCRLSSGQIVGAEALARWQTSDGVVVQPNVFVPTLEKYGFITDLDRLIWEKVCAQIRAWRDAGLNPVPISVNVSRQDAYNLDIAQHFENLVQRYDLPVSAIEIEITESAYVDDASKINTMAQQLRDKGFRVLIDDFGSGYSSLNMLDNLPVDVIKLDMEFMRMNNVDQKKNIRIVESTIHMAKSLGLAIITEGVETSDKVDFLRSIGCRYVQGFHFYRPMTCNDFERLLGDESLIDRSGFEIKPNDEFRLREFLDQNVYSDSMLNSILGPVSICSWKGDNVDITRFNEEFYEELGVSHLEKHLTGIQNYVDEKDLSTLYNLLNNALGNEMNGANDIIRFRMLDGTPFDLLTHLYFLGETDGYKRLYCAVHNITQVTELRNELQLMSHVTRASVAFARYRTGGWEFKLGVHGLRNELGLSRAQLEQELNDRSFFKRLNSEQATELEALTYKPERILDARSVPLDLALDDGTIAHTKLTSHNVKNEQLVFSYVLILEMW